MKFQTFDFPAPRFIQLLIRKAFPPRACLTDWGEVAG